MGTSPTTENITPLNPRIFALTGSRTQDLRCCWGKLQTFSHYCNYFDSCRSSVIKYAMWNCCPHFNLSLYECGLILSNLIGRRNFLLLTIEVSLLLVLWGERNYASSFFVCGVEGRMCSTFAKTLDCSVVSLNPWIQCGLVTSGIQINMFFEAGVCVRGVGVLVRASASTL